MAVGHHHVRPANAQVRVHDFVFRTGRARAVRRIGIFLEAHHVVDFGAQRVAVELDGFLAAAVEEQVDFNVSGWFGIGVHGCVGLVSSCGWL